MRRVGFSENCTAAFVSVDSHRNSSKFAARIGRAAFKPQQPDASITAAA
jgi:hypothetical protein